jgi:hypothetical protein
MFSIKKYHFFSNILVYANVVGRLEAKSLTWGIQRQMEILLTPDLQDTGCETQGHARFQCQVLMNTIINLRCPKTARNALTSWALIRISSTIVPRGDGNSVQHRLWVKHRCNFGRFSSTFCGRMYSRLCKVQSTPYSRRLPFKTFFVFVHLLEVAVIHPRYGFLLLAYQNLQ